jgi:demethylmenaquinone methyltransferase/2-methoxy-6-polyprenyl-1,4-benzoquinol methylase
MTLSTSTGIPEGIKKADFVQSLFNTIAQRYDLLNDCISFGMHRQWKQEAVAKLNLQMGDTALDVCTGTGDLLSLLLKTVGSTGKVTGLDFSEEMLKIAHQRYATTLKTTAPTLNLIQGDAMALPFPENTFNASIVSFGLRNVTTIETAVLELVRVVKPGGVVLNLDTCPQVLLPGFDLYFSKIMPFFGKLLAGNQSAYQYLQASSKNFLPPEALQHLFQQCGLEGVTVKRTGFGSVAMVYGKKPLQSHS